MLPRNCVLSSSFLVVVVLKIPVFWDVMMMMMMMMMACYCFSSF